MSNEGASVDDDGDAGASLENDTPLKQSTVDEPGYMKSTKARDSGVAATREFQQEVSDEKSVRSGQVRIGRGERARRGEEVG